MNNIHHIVLSFVLILFSLNAMAQGQCEVSSLVRQLIAENPKKDGVTKAKESISKVKGNAAEETAATAAKSICCFVRVDDGCNIDEVISRLDGRCQLRMGNLCIVTLPVAGLAELSVTKGIKRIEANTTRNHITTDLTRRNIHVNEVHEGASPLPHPFRGKGTVLGIMDIGFDLTHPNFRSSDGSRLRIGALWDQLKLSNDNESSNSNDNDNVSSNDNESMGCFVLDDILNFRKDSPLPIGMQYIGEEALLTYAHSFDGETQTHGTHTLGIAAGSGYTGSADGSGNATSDTGNGLTSPYIGMAPEADICCVANATGNNHALIPEEMLYLYTYALDVLGFKYCFNYADALGKPCVISFSEGSPQDLIGDDVLYYEMLEAITGPGHIIVSAAGNNGAPNNFMHKTEGTRNVGAGMRKWAMEKGTMSFTIDTTAPVDLKFIAYDKGGRKELNDTIVIPLDFLPESEETTSPSGLINKETTELKQHFGSENYTFTVFPSPNCYDASRRAYYVALQAETKIGYPFDVDILVEDNSDGYAASGDDGRSIADGTMETLANVKTEAMKTPADVKIYCHSGELISNASSNRCDAINEANIVSPASAPCVICVGSTAYRTEVVNYYGKKKTSYSGENGAKSPTSSVGPTMDGRIKPDVMAPGANIISSYSSHYLEYNPEASDIDWDVEHFDYNGRTYAWNSNSGTSMACPAVAGIIALWLEACPTLSPKDVLDVIARTSRRIDPSLSYTDGNYPNSINQALPYPNNLCGYGEIDAYAGLLHLLQFDKIKNTQQLTPRNSRIVRYNGQHRLAIGEAASHHRLCDIYSTDGIKQLTVSIPPGAREIELTDTTLRNGFYLLVMKNQKH